MSQEIIIMDGKRGQAPYLITSHLRNKYATFLYINYIGYVICQKPTISSACGRKKTRSIVSLCVRL